MNSILLSLSCLLVISAVHAEKVLFDFSNANSVGAFSEQSDTIRPVGSSKAALVSFQNAASRRAVFFALVNPQSSAPKFGWAGVRAVQNLNLSGLSKLQIRSRAQGQFGKFKIILTHKGLNNDPNPSYEQIFQAPKGEFGVNDLPLSGFKPYVKGQLVNAEPLDVSQISSIGVQFYAGASEPEQQKGPVALEIDWIKAL